MLSLVVFDARSQRGSMPVRRNKAADGLRLRWQKAEWDIIGTPWVINSGMLLRLRNMENQRTQHLWVAADSMDAGEWRPAPAGVAKPTQE
jgi:toxin CptA